MLLRQIISNVIVRNIDRRGNRDRDRDGDRDGGTRPPRLPCDKYFPGHESRAGSGWGVDRYIDRYYIPSISPDSQRDRRGQTGKQ